MNLATITMPTTPGMPGIEYQGRIISLPCDDLFVGRNSRDDDGTPIFRKLDLLHRRAISTNHIQIVASDGQWLVRHVSETPTTSTHVDGSRLSGQQPDAMEMPLNTGSTITLNGGILLRALNMPPPEHDDDVLGATQGLPPEEDVGDILGGTQPQHRPLTEGGEVEKGLTPTDSTPPPSPHSTSRQRKRRAARRRPVTPGPRDDVLRLLKSDHHRDEDVVRLRHHLAAVQHDLNGVRDLRNEIQRRLRLKDEQRRRRRVQLNRDRDEQRGRRHRQALTWCRHKDRCIRRGCCFRHPIRRAPLRPTDPTLRPLGCAVPRPYFP